MAWQLDVREGGKAYAGFLVDLPPLTKRTFHLKFVGPEVKTDLVVQRDGTTWIVGTSRCAVRVPSAEGFKPGTPFEKLAAPIMGIRTISGRWIGQGRLTPTRLAALLQEQQCRQLIHHVRHAVLRPRHAGVGQLPSVRY